MKKKKKGNWKCYLWEKLYPGAIEIRKYDDVVTQIIGNENDLYG